VLLADYLEEITWSFRKQKLRTFLTATGIGIGSFALALMVGLGAGLQSYIEAQIRAFGNPRVVMVLPEVAKQGEQLLDQLEKIGKPAEPVSSDEDQEKTRRRGGLWITAEQSDALRAVKGVRSVSPFIGLDVDGIRLATAPVTSDTVWYKVDFATLGSNPIMGTLTAGSAPGWAASLPSPGASVASDSLAEVVLSPQYARSFGKGETTDPSWLLGQEVELRVPKLSQVSSRFAFRDPTKFKNERRVFRAKVVGLAEESPFSRVVFCELDLGRRMARYQSQNPDLLSEEKIGFQAIVRVADDADPVVVKAEIQKLGLMARSTEDQLKAVSSVFLVVDSFLTVFGLIALFVATFGIVNTLLMAITERTREIGVMKALGATRATIRSLFAAEAAAIGVVGGIGGATSAFALGQLANLLVHRFPIATALKGYAVFVFPWWLLLGSVVFATLVGTLAGIYPANRAAGLNPIDALRYE
jgi:putative ABC transport system permease protein